MAVPIAAVAAIAGTGFSIFGEVQAAKAESAALNKRAGTFEEQAAEILERSEINMAKMGQQALSLISERAVGAASRGIANASQFVNQEAIIADLMTAVADERRESEFEASNLRKQAQFDREAAEDRKKSALWRGLGAGLGGAGKVLSLLK